jgi:hypothetical protein
VDRQADLVQVVQTLAARRSRPHFLDGGEQEADEDSDDGYHHQQLDQREACTGAHGELSHTWPV